MSLVWENSRARGTSLLVMLALADWASDDGGNIYPAIETIAKKTRISVRAVQYEIRKLTDLGELTFGSQSHINPTGQRTNDYRINVQALQKGVQNLHPLDEKGVQILRGANFAGCNPASKGVQPIAPNPSYPSLDTDTEQETASASGASPAAQPASGSFGDWQTTDSARAIRNLLASEGVKKVDDVMYQTWERGLSFVEIDSIREELYARYKGSKGRLTQWPGFFTKRFLTQDYSIGQSEGVK